MIKEEQIKVGNRFISYNNRPIEITKVYIDEDGVEYVDYQEVAKRANHNENQIHWLPKERFKRLQMQQVRSK